MFWQKKERGVRDAYYLNNIQMPGEMFSELIQFRWQYSNSINTLD